MLILFPPCVFTVVIAVKHIQMDVFVNDIKVNNTQMKTGDLSVDKMLDAFNNILSITLNKHAPLKKTQVKTQPHPWYNEDIKDARLYNNICIYIAQYPANTACSTRL